MKLTLSLSGIHHDHAMSTSQNGIFALGTASHAYLELDARQPDAMRELVSAVASLREPRTTMGGINLVAGFRPELWREVVPDDAPSRVEGFNRDLVGADGYTMPATQHDAVLWLSGSAYDVVFDAARGAIAALESVASLADETSSWPYQHDRDLTGFIDGSENPDLIDAAELATIPDGRPGRRRQRPAPAEMEPRRNRLGIAPGRASGAGHRADEGRERGARRQASRFPCRPH